MEVHRPWRWDAMSAVMGFGQGPESPRKELPLSHPLLSPPFYSLGHVPIPSNGDPDKQ